jgi:type II secretory pathway pseudopilin PulG
MVEILVVIAIIGILATITFMGFGRYQADTRDSARSNQATILTEALEKYYEQNGEYPSCSALTNANAATVTTSVLPGVQPQTLVTPQAPSGTTNSIQCTDLTSTSQPDFFAYVGDTSSTCLGSGDCLIFQLKYVQESTGQIVTINSRHKTTFAVSGSPLLASTPDGSNGFTQINSSWPAIASSTSYDLQRSTSNDFSTNLITTNTTSTSVSSTGLSYNTLYFFRVRANSATGNGPWSNITTPTTWSLTTPVVSAVANSSTTFTSSWPAVAHASSYTAQCSSDGVTLWSSCSGSTASTSFNWGPTGPGNKLYFRTQAVNGVYTSSWSNVASVTSPIAAPNGPPGISGGMSGGNAVGNASATSCSEGTLMYQMVYDTNDGAWSAPWGTWSTTLPSISVGASQGYKYIFAVSAICRGVSIDSAQSGIPSAVVVDPIAQPPAPNYLWPAWYTHGINQDPSYSGNCPAGTWAVNGTFRDHFVSGASYGPHPWGYVGSPWISAGYVEYWGQNQCTTAYYASPMSPESYNYLRIN